MNEKKLTTLEIGIIRVIAETHPYSENDVEMVYRRCKSFDTTINIIQEALAHAESLEVKLGDYGC